MYYNVSSAWSTKLEEKQVTFSRIVICNINDHIM